MKYTLLAIFIFTGFTFTASASELRFDPHGKILQPDMTYLSKGLEAQSAGYTNDAMRYLIRSAEFGNPYAITAIGYIKMQQADYPEALAWFNLIELKMLDKPDDIRRLIVGLKQILNESEVKLSNEIKATLIKKYGKDATLAHRESWQKNIKVGGSKIKGHIPNRVKMYSAGRIEQKAYGEAEIFVSASFVSGHEVRQQIDSFVYEYEFNFIQGKVKLNDIQFIDDERRI